MLTSQRPCLELKDDPPIHEKKSIMFNTATRRTRAHNFERSNPVVYGQLFIVLAPSLHTYKVSCVSQLVTLGYMFRPLPDHHQANKE